MDLGGILVLVTSDSIRSVQASGAYSKSDEYWTRRLCVSFRSKRRGTGYLCCAARPAVSAFQKSTLCAILTL